MKVLTRLYYNSEQSNIERINAYNLNIYQRALAVKNLTMQEQCEMWLLHTSSLGDNRCLYNDAIIIFEIWDNIGYLVSFWVEKVGSATRNGGSNTQYTIHIVILCFWGWVIKYFSILTLNLKSKTPLTMYFFLSYWKYIYSESQ